jgi:tetratricopeptide (TPR) repeat protein
MTLENQLIQKMYYETFMDESNNGNQPIQVLGEAYMMEQKNEMPDLSYIRFAQGEVYFHNKDYEAAIFKWENIVNELESWAKKNTADAYYELGLLSSAEDIYKTIVTDNRILNTEVALQLFSLYIERGKVDSAVTVIKKTVALNPDYPNVTDLARVFFEEQQDWKNAVELVVNEAIRTESLKWFDSVKAYVDQGVTKTLIPSYFSDALLVLYGLDKTRFEQLVVAIWNSYKNETAYFAWLKEINHLLMNLDLSQDVSWHELSNTFKETYLDLIDGKHLIKKLQDLIPNLLSNWLRVTDRISAVIAPTAVLSWSELFPSSISDEMISEAETLFRNASNNADGLINSLQLFDSIMQWGEIHELGANHRIKWMVDQLTDFETQNFLIAGLNGSGKSSFVNFVLEDELLQDAPTTSVVVFKDNEQLAIEEITDYEIVGLPGLSDFHERMDRRRNALESLIEFRSPIPFLHNQRLAFIDTPGLNGSQYDRQEIYKYLHVADAVLFVLDTNAPFTDKERTILSQMHELAPELPIHFLLNKMDTIYNEQEAVRIFDETKSTINDYLPNALVFAFSSQYDQTQQLSDLNGFIHSIKNTRNIEEKRLAKLLSIIRSTITTLLQKRINIENQLVESVRWNEEMAIKLNGALNQLQDLEVEKSKELTKDYRSIKEVIQTDISETIPKMLKDCSKLISENSNFSKIHIELNDEMNSRMQDYLEKKVLPNYFRSLQNWINHSKEQLEQGQMVLDEMGEGFNVLFGEERIKLNFDFKTIDDWRRDTDRMTCGFQLEEVNIFFRRTPSQLILKSAGKLFGALSQNKAMLSNKYKSFVENEDYTEVTNLVIKRFFQSFELFEKSLERDMSWIFRNPMNMLTKSIEDTRLEIQTNEEMLKKMNTNPEMYRDPLTLFEVRLRQLEWMSLPADVIHANYKY